MSFKDVDIGNLFVDSVIDTFANMAFISVVLEKNPEEEVFCHSIMKIDFTTPIKGSILLYLPDHCKTKIIENLYGEDWASFEEIDIEDCSLELLNVLAGFFLKKINNGTKIHMFLPELILENDLIRYKDNFHDFIFNAEGIKFKSRLKIYK